MSVDVISEDHLRRYATAYASGVLRPEVHYRLVEDLDGHAARAGVSPPDVWTPLADVVGSAEYDYVRMIRGHVTAKVYGFRYSGGGWDPSVSERMCAMAGALLRNFVSARVTPSEVLITEAFRGDDVPDPEVLLIPDLAVPSERGSEPKRRVVGGIITRRATARLQTVVWIGSRSDLVQQMGEHCAAIVDRYVGAVK